MKMILVRITLAKNRYLRSKIVGALCVLVIGCQQPQTRLCPVALVPDAVAEFSAKAQSKRHQSPRPTGTSSTPIRTAGLEKARHTTVPAELLPPQFEDSSEKTLEAKVKLTKESVPQRDIDFKTALQLAGGQNPRIAFAGARIDEAAAQWQASRVLWLPNMRMGLSANKHEGPLQETGGRVFDVSRTTFQTGAGVSAVGAGTPMVPGISFQFRTADVIFQKRIDEQTMLARQSAFATTLNNLLFETASAYLDLLRAVQQTAIASETLKNTNELYKITKSFADAGQGPVADADRARTEVALRENDISRADEAILVASARLAQLLRLDPAVFLRPVDPFIMEIELVSLDHPVRELVAIGLSNRPELQENRQLVEAAVQHLRREKLAPFLPSVLLGASYSGFGGGPGANVDHMRGRFDLDAIAFWEVRNFGYGEKAQRDIAATRVQQANLTGLQIMDQVSREIVEASVQAQARKKQIDVAKSAIVAAQQSYQHNLQRIRNAKGLPLELLQSIQALDRARREYLRAVIDYNRAQFSLHRAIGRASL